jgi:hypothetical protein
VFDAFPCGSELLPLIADAPLALEPGFTTLTPYVNPVAISPAGIAAVSSLELTNVVVRL